MSNPNLGWKEYGFTCGCLERIEECAQELYDAKNFSSAFPFEVRLMFDREGYSNRYSAGKGFKFCPLCGKKLVLKKEPPT